MRLIDADLFDNELVERAKKLFGEKFKTYEEVRALLEKQPAIAAYECEVVDCPFSSKKSTTT